MGNVTNMLTCYSQPEEDDKLVLYCIGCKKCNYIKESRFCHSCGEALVVRSQTATFTQEIQAIKFEGFQQARSLSNGGTKFIAKLPDAQQSNIVGYPLSPARSIQDRTTIPTKDKMSIGYSLNVEGFDENFITDLKTKAGIADLGDLLVATREELDFICDKLNLSIGEKLRFRRSVMMHQNMERYSEQSEEIEWIESTAPPKPYMMGKNNRIINDEDSAGKVDFEKEGMLEITHQTGDLDDDDSMFSDFSDAEIHVGDWVKCRKNSVEKWSLGKVVKKGPLMIQTQGWEEPENFPLVKPIKGNDCLLENIHPVGTTWKNGEGMAFEVFEDEFIGPKIAAARMLESLANLDKHVQEVRRELSSQKNLDFTLSKEYFLADSDSELTEDGKTAKYTMFNQYQFPPPFDQMNLRSCSPNTDSSENFTGKSPEIGAITTPISPQQNSDSEEYSTLGESDSEIATVLVIQTLEDEDESSLAECESEQEIDTTMMQPERESKQEINATIVNSELETKQEINDTMMQPELELKQETNATEMQPELESKPEINATNETSP